MDKVQKVLILGSRGQLGQTLKGEIPFCKKMFEVFTPSRSELDITDKESLITYTKQNDIDIIVNCAAYTNVKGAETDYENAYAVNVKAIENICATDCKIIHISTDYVFDGEKNTPYTEEDITNPLNVYGKTKHEGEEVLLKLKPESFIIRTSWLYSKYGNNFLNNMIKKIIEQEEVFVVNDQYGAPTSCYSLSIFICEILDNWPTLKTGIYHYSNKGPCTWYDFALKINKLLIASDQYNVDKIKVKPISSTEFNDIVKRPKYSVFSLEKVQNAMNYNCVYKWEIALNNYWYFVMENNLNKTDYD
jgi:dTDP-4-dehydrorhamnose reductase